MNPIEKIGLFLLIASWPNLGFAQNSHNEGGIALDLIGVFVGWALFIWGGNWKNHAR